MKFPPLEVMVKYGVYTVKDLENFYRGRQTKVKNLSILNECKECAVVYENIKPCKCHST